MSPELNPQHSEVARKASELIQRSIQFGKDIAARAIFGASEQLETPVGYGNQENVMENPNE